MKYGLLSSCRISWHVIAGKLSPVLFAALFSFIFVSCSSGSFVDLQSLKSQLGIDNFPGRNKYPDADEVVLSDVHDVYVMIDRDYNIETNITVTKVTKLLRNVDDHASVEIHVYSGDRIYGLAARTIEPDGSSIALGKKDFHTITGGGSDYIFYSDEKKVRFTFPAVKENCIIEYHYTIHEAHPFIEDIWEIQGEYPILRNEYKLTLPAKLLVPPQNGGYGWNWRYKVYNCNLGKPAYRENTDENPDYETITLRWLKRDIPAFEPDPMMPPYTDYLQYVKFAPSDWKTWNDISDWYYRFLFEPQLVITPAISEKARELTEGCKNQTQKIRKIFDFVQTLRYVAVELGQGGYVPSKPETVLRQMYGDCKDKSILLISLLRSAGITAKPVLVLTSNEGVVDPGFPCWTFNHMIVKATTASGDKYWLDPTVEHCALNEIPYDDQGTNSLVLNYDNTSEIERIPSSTFSQNAENISAKVNIDKSGQADFSVGIRFKGQENLGARRYLAGKSRHEILRFCNSLVAENYLNARVTRFSVENSENVDTSLVLHFDLHVPNALRTNGNTIVLNIDPFKISGDWAWLARDHRTYDMEFGFPRIVTKTIDVVFPDKFKVDRLPRETVDSTDGLYFSKSYMLVGSDRFVVSETFAIMSKIIGRERFKSVKQFAEEMRAAPDEMILLSEKNRHAGN